MIYADWYYYETVYGGTVLDQTNYLKYAIAACAEIDNMTFGRLSRRPELVDDNVKMAVCSLAETLFSCGNMSVSPEIASENIDGWSRSYKDTAEQQMAKKVMVQNAIAPFLPSFHPLRYRGV